MFFSRRRKKYVDQTRTAPATQRVTPTLSVSVWQARDAETGSVRLHWQVVRSHPENSHVTYRTLRLESILEFPEFLARIASGFSTAPGVAEPLRRELKNLSDQLVALVEIRRADGLEQLKQTEKAGEANGLNCIF